MLDKTGADNERKKLLAQIENKLSTIARQGRAFGIHLILATQRPDATIIPGQIRNNMDFRVCGRADSVLSQIILDNTSAAEQIPKRRKGAVSSPGMGLCSRATCSTRSSYKTGGRFLWRGRRRSTTTAPGYPTMKWRPWPVSCSRRYRPFRERGRTAGSLPSARRETIRKSRVTRGGNICNGNPSSLFTFSKKKINPNTLPTWKCSSGLSYWSVGSLNPGIFLSQAMCRNFQTALPPSWPLPPAPTFTFDTLFACVFQTKLSRFWDGCGIGFICKEVPSG